MKEFVIGRSVKIVYFVILQVNKRPKGAPAYHIYL